MRIAAAAPPRCPRPTELEERTACVRSSSYLATPAYRGPARARLTSRLVPEANHRIGPIVLVPHGTQAGRAEEEVPARPGLEPEPARGEHPEKVSAREEQRVPLDGPHPAYHAVGTRSDLVGRLSCRRTVAKELPVWPLGVDVDAGATFIRAIVPF